ncbi:MAG: RNA-guided pseudouridylation complex pseudouridine synthase subunit Cbf5 [Candidatus Altiarchaeum hamiconexum]|uniref:Probable tRNA pseudouridine synthase B n=1 Tax=Candidatus Altarchaeum hamiconexum TaxID=1803513 RepID=A0A8J7Z1E7_9ARCH|nr:RNA-guided pseudouridylation complex pseudouridine synthase subunit Cbf5 [Candidatus Altarchaeum hamiconexum]OIQ04567.1 MAG: tRNA pseudouridine(55) synthase TruB [Candidatus Altarchaeum sp. CG2_30_32_3053]PIN67723.1 MAG: RNA-guided pseudouridylation complex pseudouridine synthase subunit Cbf5 [Candidatus Altarchaeum sp. CG12_big_fil_rev_8_21_14_0_65_33_22]PIV28978.1 MAG: RNA-guided pseudouridylation complex pseudouridine synthase subunit Cbf5 [Candidatus Altarchaeum sp. CG03_land_8_20_14_0_80
MKFSVKEEDIIVKHECETDPRYGCEPENRKISDYIIYGIINIDKVKGPTSHQISYWVKQMLGLKKVGHGGTLDPNVTGILTILPQNSTKVERVIASVNKEYVGIINFSRPIEKKKIERLFEYFTGEIYQKPPLESAVSRRIRNRTVYFMKFLEMDEDRINVLFRVGCEAGTYIRVLCKDIGLMLGMNAVMADLRRTRSGIFDENSCVYLQDLKDAFEIWKETGDEKYLRNIIHPVEEVCDGVKKIWVKDSAVNAVCYGANLKIPGIARFEKGIKQNDTIAIMSLKNELVAIGKSLRTSEEIEKMDKGEIVDIDRVIMERDVYPKLW